MRAKLGEMLAESKLWDGDVQVVDCLPETAHLRALMSARDSPAAWDLRCKLRDKMMHRLQQEYPSSLPRKRTVVDVAMRVNTEL